jgi:hypothetical protein
MEHRNVESFLAPAFLNLMFSAVICAIPGAKCSAGGNYECAIVEIGMG